MNLLLLLLLLLSFSPNENVNSTESVNLSFVLCCVSRAENSVSHIAGVQLNKGTILTCRHFAHKQTKYIHYEVNVSRVGEVTGT